MSLTRNVLSAVLCLAASLGSGYAQSSVAFTTHNYPKGPIPRNVYAVDVNNDGVPDLVQDTSQLPNKFTVSIANGDGSFRAPVTAYTFPFQYQGVVPVASGDVNGDGKVDLIFELAGSNQLAVFLGKGDGTFQTPKYVTIALPGGQHFGGLPLVAADFNKDGKLDLVTSANTNTAGSLYLMEGDGTGNFGAPRTVYTPAPNLGLWSVGAGDFDGDGNADLAFTVSSNCTPGGCGTSLHVMYGDGGAGFRDTTVYSSGGIYQFSTGDVDSNGTTDVFGVDGGTNSVVVLYGQTYKAFVRFSMAAAQGFGTLVLGDFNGDGKMDLAGLGTGHPYPESFVFYLANDAGGFTEQVYGFAASSNPTNVVAGDFNRDTKPDLAVIGNNPPAANSTITVGENVTPNGNWDGCNYPHSGQGIAVCATTGTTTSPVRVLASANSYGQLRKMELWVDGKKIVEQHHTWGQRAWFDLTSGYATGSHNATLFAADIDNRLQKTAFSFTVGAAGSCSAPSSPGVHVCKPANGSAVGSPVQVQAAATITGTLARMELWVDGVKKYSETSSKTLSTSISLAAGSHRFAIFAVNAAGTKWQGVSTATVK